MDPVAVLPHLAVVAILTAVAGVDLLTFTISNKACLAILALLPVAWLTGGPVPEAWSSAVAFAVVLVVFGALWAAFRGRSRTVFGGGDWKLLSALAPWVGIHNLGALLLLVSLAGGAQTILLVAARLGIPAGSGLRRHPWTAPVLAAQGVPYGVSIAAGGILVIILSVLPPEAL